jgi:chemotaxis protein methyltransferase CheR
LPLPALDNSLLPLEMREFKLFRSLVHERTGIWLRDGKQVMLASRLSRRLRHHGMDSFAAYYEYVQNSPDHDGELRELINCVTTNKTSFFREPHHFDFLAKTVMSQIRSEGCGGARRDIRVWSAACSTGEEPYSIAMSLLESLHIPPSAGPGVLPRPAVTRIGPLTLINSASAWKIEVVASDIDTKVLETAVQAVYPDGSLETVAAPLQRKYFLRGKDDMAGQVKVKPDVARLVQFKNINLMDARWPLEGLFDVIFFRNALIYFNQETQNIFLRRMARYLKPRGYLFLGNSEHIPWLADIFSPLNQTMYQLRDAAR